MVSVSLKNKIDLHFHAYSRDVRFRKICQCLSVNSSVLASLIVMVIVIVLPFMFTFRIVYSLLILFHHALYSCLDCLLVLRVDCLMYLMPHSLVGREAVGPVRVSYLFCLYIPSLSLSCCLVIIQSPPLLSCLLIPEHVSLLLLCIIILGSAFTLFFLLVSPLSLPAPEY